MALQDDDPFAASPPLPHEQLRIIVTARRVRYLTLGYEPIPVLSGRKRPALNGWRNVKLDIGTVSAWASDRPNELSTGIRTRYTPGFDIDIYDPNIADQVQQALLNMIPQQGTILKRVGLPPKRLIPLRCETPFKKIIATFRSPDDIVHKVEVLADGQQFVAEGIHETTQQPYRWADNVNLLNVAHEHLPLVDEALAQRVVAEASEIMGRAGWVEISGKSNSKTNGKTAHHLRRRSAPISTRSITAPRSRTNAPRSRPCPRIAAATTRSTTPPSTCSNSSPAVVSTRMTFVNAYTPPLRRAASWLRTAQPPCAPPSKAVPRPDAHSRDKPRITTVAVGVMIEPAINITMRMTISPPTVLQTWKCAALTGCGAGASPEASSA
jgi:hypothetical protein